MSAEFKFNVSPRAEKGTGVSRNLRRLGKVPAILYGAKKEPMHLTVPANELVRELRNEAIFSHVISLSIDGKIEKAIIKSLHRHPYKPEILHVDFQRVSANTKLTVHVPLHFLGEDDAPGVKNGGHFSHNHTDLEVSCLPKDLPEFIEIDVSSFELDQVLHLSEVKLPKGVALYHFSEENDEIVVSLHAAREEVEETSTKEASSEENSADDANEDEGSKEAE